jgi:hypothetical protein
MRRPRPWGAGGGAGGTRATAAQAQDPAVAHPPPHARQRIIYENLFAVRLNPLGIEDQLYVGWRARLWDDPAPLYRDGYVGAGPSPTLNPAVARLGGTFEFRPLTVLGLQAGLYYVHWFGTFGHLQAFPSPSSPHSDSDIKDGEDAGRNRSVGGTEAQIRAQLVGKVGPIALRDDLSVYNMRLDLAAGERVFYNTRIDAMVPNGGFALTNDTDLAWLSDFGLVVAVRGTLVHAFFRSDSYAPGEAEDNPNTPTFRLGPALAYTFYDRPGSGFNKPTIVALAQWWLAHRFRTGEDTSQAAPYGVIAFRFEGELWSSR